ncbi:MAG TPA: GxxExxY protein [Gemmatimonadaceae bacterium]|nr:GxxExxY protein [Gemmatimonadaceae bacterium]
MALLEEVLTRSIIGGFLGVHNVLGFGLSERIYLLAMEQELKARGHRVIKEVEVPVFYRDVLLQQQRLDMLVDDRVVLELKATPVLHPSARQQLLNYLRLTPYKVGLLLHFGPAPAFERVVHSRKHA